MAEFDVDAMIGRFSERAQAVRDRPLPPVAGSERQKFISQAQVVEDGSLVLRIPLASKP
jgi:hypothetical protein